MPAGGAITAAIVLAALAKLAITAAVSAAISVGASFAFNALQPEPPTATVGEIDDTQRFTSEEGGPLHRCFGERCRVGGTILWVGRIEKYKKREEISGIRINKERYQRSIAVAACQGPIESITRVFANGIQIAVSISELNVTSESYHVEVGLGVPSEAIPGFGFEIGTMRIHQPKDDPFIVSTGFDVRDFLVGALLGTFGNPPANPIGFQGTFNNPIVGFIVVDTGSAAPGDPFIDAHPDGLSAGSFWVEVINIAATTEANDGRLITLHHVIIPGLDFIGSLPYMTGMNVHRGEEDQEPDIWLNDPTGFITSLGVTGGGISTQLAPCAPAYRGVAYVVILELQLEDFGNQIPKIEFEIREKRNKSVGETIVDMLLLSGLTTSDYEIDEAVNAIQMRGYVVSGPTPMNKAIAPILRAYNVVVQETNEGKLRFMKRNAGKTWTVNESDLAAHEEAEDAVRPFEIIDVSDDTLPEQVNISFVDSTQSLVKASQRERRINLTNRNVMKLDIPVTLTPGEARSVAARELWLSIINRQKIKLRLPPTYLRIKENDIILLTANSQNYRIIVSRVERGNNYIMAVEGFLESTEGMDFDGSPGEDGSTTDDPIGNALLALVVFDKGGPVRTVEAGILGVYIGVLNLSSNIFTAADVFIAVGSVPLPDGSNIQNVGEINTESVWGRARNIPSLTAKSGVWDTESKIIIDMKVGAIASTTENLVYQGVNWARLGTEIVAYKTVVADPDVADRYIISDLLRGLRDTADEISSHVVDLDAIPPVIEIFLPLLQGNVTFFSPVPNADIGQELYFGVQVAGDPDITNIVWTSPFTYFGHSGRPFRVNNLKIEKQGTTDSLILTWDHKGTTHYGPFTTLTEPNILPPGPHWRIEVSKGSSPSVRTVIRPTRSWLYSFADQQTDGTDNTINVTFSIYEVAENGDSLVHIGVFDTT